MPRIGGGLREVTQFIYPLFYLNHIDRGHYKLMLIIMCQVSVYMMMMVNEQWR